MAKKKELKELEEDIIKVLYFVIKLQSFIKKLGLENEFINTLCEVDKWFYKTQLKEGGELLLGKKRV